MRLRELRKRTDYQIAGVQAMIEGILADIMNLTTRRIIAAFTALVTVVAAAMWTLVGEDWLADLAYFLRRNVPISQAGAPRPDAWDGPPPWPSRLRRIYVCLSCGALWC